jgi:hypothetical protein
MKMAIATFEYIIFMTLLVGQASASQSLNIIQENQGVNFLQKGYEEISLKLQFNLDGTPIQGAHVQWTILNSDNNSDAMSPDHKTSIAGLSWEKPAPGNIGAITKYVTVTDNQGMSVISLVDIVGERTVTVQAQVSYEGNLYKRECSVTFGKGPLSVFSSPPIGPLSWLDLYKKCNSEPYSGEPSRWEIGQGFAGGAKLPTMQQIQAVSLPGEYNKQANAMGAAIAAGWPNDHRYWNGRVVMKMRASHVDIRDGNPHGSGGNNVHGEEYGVCLH